ncbi:MAG: hypothetical protein ACR2HF_04195, partial [Methylococcaceae bacterium]
MHYKSQEIVIADIHSTHGGILSLVRMQNADVWFVSEGIKPRRLLHKALVDVDGIGGLHLVGRFTRGGFSVANTLLGVNDFPVIEAEHNYLAITFWCEECDRDKKPNEVFMNDLVERTRTPVFIAIFEQGKGFFRHQYKAVTCTSPPPIFW